MQISSKQTNQSLTYPTQLSNTKRTLLELLQKQTQLLRIDIIQNSQKALIKQLAKRKVIYKLSRKNQLELVYAYIALSEHYIQKSFMEAALKNLIESLDIIQTGDALFLIGQIYFNQNKLQQAKKYFQSSLQNDWIEPSNDHKIASRLQCMTFLQKIYFSYGVSMKQKLLQLSQKKIKETQKQNLGTVRKSDKYFLALSMADLAIIHQAFEEYEIALQKISQAISILQTSNQDPQKLLDFYLKKAGLHEKISKKNFIQDDLGGRNVNSKVHQKEILSKGMNLIQNYDLSEQKVVNLLERVIRNNIF